MHKTEKVKKVRFAPAPTGYLHVGGARTALFNWLYAKNTGGKLVLRIEDTDAVRSTEESTKAIFDSLEWLGIDWDEGPFFQSGRKEIYRKYAQELLSKGLAYESDEVKGAHKAVIFKLPDNRKIVVRDLIHADVEFDTSVLKDIVLMKSDGTAAYNFACVIDDHLMGITHIIRGDDHISNTPKQILLYEALGFPLPEFAHVPLILGPDGSRLSKRHGATSVGQYKKEGYFSKAFVNFLALLGWAPGDNREKMSIEEIIKSFSLERIGKKGAIFDVKKLQWLNGVYIREMSLEALTSAVLPYLEESGITNKDTDEDHFKFIISLVQERLKTFSEITELAGFFFAKDIEYDESAVKKYLLKEGVAGILGKIINEIEREDAFSAAALEKSFIGVKEEMNISNSKLIHPVRVAVTGSAASPPIFETMIGIGRENCLKRLKNTLSFLNAGKFPFKIQGPGANA
ncbi:MAG: glutamate--tRNA ligase [Candidatus Aureabacteria bacterium]|nr:glutamate--tRNA ligase [Candidatus Auribacterota bacterium]